MSSVISDEFAKGMYSLLMRVIDSILDQIQTKLTTMANELDTFISTQEAANTRIAAAVEGVKGDVSALKDQITQLLKDAPTAEQQEKLRALEAAAGIADKLEALDAETPAATPETPVDPENVAGLNDKI